MHRVVGLVVGSVGPDRELDHAVLLRIVQDGESAAPAEAADHLVAVPVGVVELGGAQVFHGHVEILPDCRLHLGGGSGRAGAKQPSKSFSIPKRLLKQR